jgi:hypothetical protein
MTLFALGLSYKGELLLAFEFAAFSGRFKLFISSGDDHSLLNGSYGPGHSIPFRQLWSLSSEVSLPTFLFRLCR